MAAITAVLFLVLWAVGAYYVGIFFAFVAYFCYYTIGTAYGATPGKDIVGISIVREKDGEAPGQVVAPRRVIAHELLALLLTPTIIGCVLMYLWMVWDKKHQTWYDKAAGTMVVQHQ